jgi:hypothetical protein
VNNFLALTSALILSVSVIAGCSGGQGSAPTTSTPAPVSPTPAATPDFTFSVGPNAVTTYQGSPSPTSKAGVLTLTGTAENGFNADVDVTFSALPAGVSFSNGNTSDILTVDAPNPSTVSFQVDAASTVPTGTYTITATATSTNVESDGVTPTTQPVVVHTATFQIIVASSTTPPPTNPTPTPFTLSATNVTVVQGSSASDTVTGGPSSLLATDTINLSFSGLPSGVSSPGLPTSQPSVCCSYIIGGPGGSDTVTQQFTASANAPVGTYNVPVYGVAYQCTDSGCDTYTATGATNTATFTLTITPASAPPPTPTSTIVGVPPSITIAQPSYCTNSNGLCYTYYFFPISYTGTAASVTAQVQGFEGEVWSNGQLYSSNDSPTLTLTPNVPQYIVLALGTGVVFASGVIPQGTLDIAYTPAGGQEQSVLIPYTIYPSDEVGNLTNPDFLLLVLPTNTIYGSLDQLQGTTIQAGSPFWVDLAQGSASATLPTNVAISVSGVPAGVTATPAVNGVGDGTILNSMPVEYTTTVASNAVPGTYLITVTGTAGTGTNAVTHTTIFALTVPPSGSFRKGIGQ